MTLIAIAVCLVFQSVGNCEHVVRRNDRKVAQKTVVVYAELGGLFASEVPPLFARLAAVAARLRINDHAVAALNVCHALARFGHEPDALTHRNDRIIDMKLADIRKNIGRRDAANKVFELDAIFADGLRIELVERNRMYGMYPIRFHNNDIIS